MNIAFSRILKVGERNFEFNFRKRPESNPFYHVDVTDEKGSRIFFTMRKSSVSGWTSEGISLPLWVVAIETTLGKVIEQEEMRLIHQDS